MLLLCFLFEIYSLDLQMSWSCLGLGLQMSWSRYSFVLIIMSWMMIMSPSWLVRSLLQHYFQLPEALRPQGQAAYVLNILLAAEAAVIHIVALVRFRKVSSEGLCHISS